jgi:hypothetical protein
MYYYDSGKGSVVGCCEHDYELSVYIKGEGFLDQLIKY